MKNKKFTVILIFTMFFACFKIPAENSLNLLSSSKEKGIKFYWDSLSETGMLEKNGHQISFRKDEQIVILDSIRLSLTDAPELKENTVFVSKKFLDDVEFLFQEDNSSHFRVGAILLDAGHGGKDPGAEKTHIINGKKVVAREKDIALKVVKLLYERLSTAYPDKKIIMTRSKDEFLTLSERTEIANNLQVGADEAALYISVHMNSSLNQNASGHEVWYLSPGYRRTVLTEKNAPEDKSLFPILNSMLEEEYTTESIMIARFIMDGLQAQIGKESTARGIKAEDWFVVKNSNMPAVLIELGFVSNPTEASLLTNDKYLKKASLGIYNGISAFITHFERSKGFTSIN